MEPETKLKEVIQELEDEERLESLDREALVNLEITSDRGNECQDMMLLLNFLGFSCEVIEEAVFSFRGISSILE